MNDLSAKDLLGQLKFCVFDLETTGGNHQNDKIIEIGLVKIENLKIVEKKSYLINPEIKIPDFIQKLTGIKQKDVQKAPRIEDVINEILALMEDSVLVAHNTSFDVPFFNSVLERLDLPKMKNKAICTNLMTKYLIPHLMNTNLNYMCRIFKISHGQAHRALDDAEATAQLLLKFLDIFIEKKIKKINNLYYPRNKYELDRAHFTKKDDDPKLILKKLKDVQVPSFLTLKGENGIILFAIPHLGKDSDLALIEEKLNQMPWEILTVKLVGPYLESLVHLNLIFPKLEAPTRQEIINHITSEHLKTDIQKKSTFVSNEGNSLQVDEELIEKKQSFDFIISHHLVPDQLMIYPLGHMTPKNQLIFRYPGHKKKLLQFINSKSGKMKSNKLKEAHFHPLLRPIIEIFVENEDHHFLFSKKLPTKSPHEFFNSLDEFLRNKPHPFNFPRNYI